ncbi:MAG: hypothetical protein PUJ82_03450 [Spirochaetales bacterium]|nr:hypothetical protein [Spirochaetales bacterium]
MSSFEFTFFRVAFCFAKNRLFGVPLRSSRFPRFAQSSGRLRRSYYPCH